MRSISRNQRGSSHILALLGVLVIAAVGFAAYRVLNTSNSASPAASPTAVVAASDQAPAQIKNTSDLKKASNALSNTNIDGSVNPNQLDNDVSALQ